MRYLPLYFTILLSLNIHAYEVDDFYCSRHFEENPGLGLKSEMNDYVRVWLKDAVRAANEELQGGNFKACKAGSHKVLFDAIKKRLGNGDVSPIEKEVARDYYLAKTCKPDIDVTNCDALRGPIVTWLKTVSFVSQKNKTIGQSISLCGETVGTDKLGHFFSEGRTILSSAVYLKFQPQRMIREQADAMERGLMGLKATGVYSYADITANIYGAKFYTDIFEDNKDAVIACKVVKGKPVFRTKEKEFNWCNYINPAWNESINCSKYAKENEHIRKQQMQAYGYTCPMNKEKCTAAYHELLQLTLSPDTVKMMLNCTPN